MLVNATNSRGLEIEFDITLHVVPCSQFQIDAADPSGQPQSLHVDKYHQVWNHRIKMSEDGKSKTLIGTKTRLESGSTLHSETDLIAEAEASGKILNETAKVDKDDDENNSCGSCYGAGEEGHVETRPSISTNF